jgi:hypothetical protein
MVVKTYMALDNIKNKKNIILIYFKIKKYFKK